MKTTKLKNIWLCLVKDFYPSFSFVKLPTFTLHSCFQLATAVLDFIEGKTKARIRGYGELPKSPATSET